LRGRKPKPGARAQQDGDTRKIGAHKLREKIAAEPKSSGGLPTCPPHLDARARAAWEFWRAELAAMGLDSSPDAQMLEGACVAYESAVWAYEQIKQYGRLLLKKEKVTKMVNDPATGQLVPSEEMVVTGFYVNPAVRISKDAWMQVRAFCSEFGLSPVSRTRLAVEKQSSAMEDLAEILSQPRVPRQTTTVQ